MIHLFRDEFLVLACDGVWDVLSNEEVVSFLASCRPGQASTPLPPLPATPGDSLVAACDSLLEHCVRLGSTDNLTVCLVALSAAVARAMDGTADGTADDLSAGFADEDSAAGVCARRIDESGLCLSSTLDGGVGGTAVKLFDEF